MWRIEFIFYGFTLSCNKSGLFYADTIWQDTGIKEVRSGFNLRFYMCSTDIWLLTEYSLSPLLKNETVHFLFHFWLCCFSSTVAVFLPHHSPHPSHPHLPPVIPPPVCFSVCVLYSCSCKLFSPSPLLPPPTSPPVILMLFSISKSLCSVPSGRKRLIFILVTSLCLFLYIG